MMSGYAGYMFYRLRYMFYYAGGLLFLMPIFIFASIAVMIGVAVAKIIKISKGTETQINGGMNYFTESTEEREFYIKGQENNDLNNDVIRCPMCQSEVQKEQKFCDNCGYKQVYFIKE